jgi:hypothetical protein
MKLHQPTAIEQFQKRKLLVNVNDTYKFFLYLIFMLVMCKSKENETPVLN